MPSTPKPPSGYQLHVNYRYFAAGFNGDGIAYGPVLFFAIPLGEGEVAHFREYHGEHDVVQKHRIQENKRLSPACLVWMNGEWKNLGDVREQMGLRRAGTLWATIFG